MWSTAKLYMASCSGYCNKLEDTNKCYQMVGVPFGSGVEVLTPEVFEGPQCNPQRFSEKG